VLSLFANDITVETGENPFFIKDSLEINYLYTDVVEETTSKMEIGLKYTENLYSWLNINTTYGYQMSDTKYFTSSANNYGVGLELFYDFNKAIYLSYSTNLYYKSTTYTDTNGLELANNDDIKYDNELSIYFATFKYIYNKVYFGISMQDEIGMYYGFSTKYEYVKDFTFGFDIKVLTTNNTDFTITSGYIF
jgi:hypothetical protein